MDKKANTQWKKADKSYKNYTRYIQGKQDKFVLNLIDILYVRNFKGGNSSIHEEENLVNDKLKRYSEALREINKEFVDRPLKGLSPDELEEIKSKAHSFVLLPREVGTSIDGFKSSYASALMHFYFPSLIPILDRRVLNGVGISVIKNAQGQVINIEQYYSELIDRFYRYLWENPTKSIRDYDKECFIKPIQDE